MAKDDRRELAWASFGPGVRISGSSSETPAVAKSDSVTLWRTVIEGDMCVLVEDKAMRRPVVVPWHNVGSCEYMPEEAVVVEPSTAKGGKAKPEAQA